MFKSNDKFDLFLNELKVCQIKFITICKFKSNDKFDLFLNELKVCQIKFITICKLKDTMR